MITVKITGGLGNNLFMMAAAIGYSIKHNMYYQIPVKVDNPHYAGQQPYIFPGVNYADDQFDPSGVPEFKENGFAYQEIPYMQDVCLNGYFQSEKYFSHCKPQILQAFGFPYQMDKGFVSIHVRHGDYLKLQHYHTVQSVQYFMRAISFFNEKGYHHFKIFGNGMTWCKENLNDANYPGCRFVYMEGNDEVTDMRLAANCEHHIGSAGTFSWWVNFLNQNPEKISTFPSPWFGPEGPKDTQDIYPKNCMAITN